MTTTYKHDGETMERLLGSGQIDDALLWRLIEMAGYDMRAAEVEVDAEAGTLTIRQTPHQGEPQETTAYLPIGPVIEEWLSSEEDRIAGANIYDYSADEVASIREDIKTSEEEGN